MFKKFIAALSVMAVLVTTLPVAFAVPLNLVDSVALSVSGGSASSFSPTTGQSLNIDIDFATESQLARLQQSSGTVKVVQGGSDVHTISTWSNGNFPQNTITWDGQDSGSAFVGAGDYEISVFAQAVDGDTFEDTETASFTVVSSVGISSLTSSADSFNPLLSQVTNISFVAQSQGFFTVDILNSQGSVVRTLINNIELSAGTHNSTTNSNLSWNGRDSGNQTVSGGTYTIRARSKATSSGAVLDTQTVTVDVTTPSTLSLEIFNLEVTEGGPTFDPSEDGNNSDLVISYDLNTAADSITIDIRDFNGIVVRNFTPNQSQLETGAFTWNGLVSDRIALPGAYTVEFEATQSGSASLSRNEEFTVRYDESDKPSVSSLSVAPRTIDPDEDDAVIEFRNNETSFITVEILNSSSEIIRTFSSFDHDSYSDGRDHSIAWNGRNDADNKVDSGNYTARVIVRNDFGADFDVENITVDDQGSTSSSTSNAHIRDISLSPSSKFEPAEDDEMIVEFDVREDLDELIIEAVKGSDRIELYNEDSVDEQNNVEVTWDGTIDNDGDEYVDAGSWRIEFSSRLDGTRLTASKSIDVEYDKPRIDDFLISKDDLDTDLGEFTYALFRIDDTAEVTIRIMEDNQEEDILIEEFEVVRDRWYAIEYDGDNFDEDDDVELRLEAANIANEDVVDIEEIKLDFDEDDPSNSKSNITNDYISPVITNGNEEMEIFYLLEEEADVKITIHKGSSSSGSTVATLIDIEDQESGDHVITWNGKDKNGNKLSKGEYTYKITSKLSSTETETGTFVVGTVGEIDGSATGSGSSSDSSSNNTSTGNNNVAPGVVINGSSNSDDDDDDDNQSISSTCAGFPDVGASSSFCDAIEWASNEGIFVGNPDGTFRPNNAINRAEVLKVILEAYGISSEDDLGAGRTFSDVDTLAWYAPYISIANVLGIFDGDNNGSSAGVTTARPADSVNRVEALKLALEAGRAVGLGSVPVCSSSPFSDVDAGAWYINYACVSSDFDLFDVSGNNFNPSSSATRAEIAEMLYRMDRNGLL